MRPGGVTIPTGVQADRIGRMIPNKGGHCANCKMTVRESATVTIGHMVHTVGPCCIDDYQTQGDSMRRCQCCKRRTAKYITGNDGFGAKAGAYVCDNFSCRTWASGGYPVTFKAAGK